MRSSRCVAGTVACLLSACAGSVDSFATGPARDSPVLGDRLPGQVGEPQFGPTSLDDILAAIRDHEGDTVAYRPGVHPQDFRTREFRASGGLAPVRAEHAYARGATGADLDPGRAAGQGWRDRNVVAVIDTGLDIASPHFAGRVVAPRDFVDGDEDPMPGPSGARESELEPPILMPSLAHVVPAGNNPDHGSHVAGIVAAARDGTAMHGIAFDARIMPIRMDMEGAVAGEFRHARANGAAVLNNSWGTLRPIRQTTRERLMRDYGDFVTEARQAAEAGLLVVFASANHQPDGAYPYRETNLEAGLPLHFPELEPNWIAVVALDQTGDRIAGFSPPCDLARNWCLAAPGEDILSVGLDGRTYRASGTSMAAPHVSGALVVLLQLFPYLKPEEVRRVLLETAVDLGEPGVDPVFGWGRLDLDRASNPVGTLTLASARDTHVADAREGAAGSAFAAAGAFGDGVRQAFAQAPRIAVFDRYGRGFSVDLAAFAVAAEHLRPGREDGHPYLGAGAEGWTAPLGDEVQASVALVQRSDRAGAEAGLVYRDKLSVAAGHVQENGAVLGARGVGAFSTAGGAATSYVALGGRAELGSRADLRARGWLGQTRLDPDRDAILTGFTATSSAFDLELGVADALRQGDRLTLALGQPLRVEAGRIRIDVPVGRDGEGRILREAYAADPSPSGREIDLRLGWRGPVAAGTLDLDLTLRLSPGHERDAGPAVAVAGRFVLPF